MSNTFVTVIINLCSLFVDSVLANVNICKFWFW